EIYGRFMGTDPKNPRSDYARRLLNFDRACDAGMWVANPGVLLGLNPDVAWELLALLAHVRHLETRGMEVYVSLPRLRRGSGTAYPPASTTISCAASSPSWRSPHRGRRW